MFNLNVCVLVFVGAGLGGLGRYALGRLLQQPSVLPFALSTFSVNMFGAFLAGLLLTSMGAEWVKSHPLGLMLMTGFLGGLTTFSAFTVEGVALFQTNLGLGLLHTCAHVGGCLLAFWLASKVMFVLSA